MNDFTEPRYVCNLCEAKCDPRTVISHLIGYKHRLRYFVSNLLILLVPLQGLFIFQKDVRSDIYAEIQMAPEPDARQMLKEKAKEIERVEGRAKIRQKCEPSLASSSNRPKSGPPPPETRKLYFIHLYGYF